MNIHRTTYCCIAAATLLLCFTERGGAQVFGTDFHTVTVQVAVITTVRVSAGSVSLNITNANAVAGQDQMSTSDQSTSLLWGTNSSGRKITASTSLAAPRFTLTLQAVNPTQGTAAAPATLTTAAKDLLLNIGRSSGSCTLQYTGTALASQGTGSDAHVITFTVQTQ